MPHSTNIQAFLTAANGQDPLLQCYCGLVVLELVVKQEVGLSDHNVIHGLNKLRAAVALNEKSWTAAGFRALTNKLRTDLVAVYVNGSDGLPRTIPIESYPYIRYCRLATDGWPYPHTSSSELATLASTVQQVRTFLKAHFSLPT